MKNVRIKLLGASTFAFVLGSHGAIAQDAPAPQAAAAESQEIVVTAQKRAERLQDVPASISAVTGASLEQAAASQLLDYANFIPGVAIASGGTPGQVRIVIRGITTGNISSALVGTYLDETPVGASGPRARAAIYGLDPNPYDIERVEVLRGPQGTLYGASSMGGLIKYVSKTPDLNKVEARAGSEVSGTDHSGAANWSVRGALNVPLITDKLAVRVSGYTRSDPGYITNVGLGVKDENASTEEGGRVSLLWKPTDTLKILAAGTLQNIRSDGNSVVTVDPVTYKPLYGDYSRKTSTPEPFKSKMRFYTINADNDFGFATLTSATSWTRSSVRQNSDTTLFYGPLFPRYNPAVAPGISSFNLAIDLNKFTQELRLASRSGGRLEWTLGGFYTDEDVMSVQGSSALTLAGKPTAIDPLSNIVSPSQYKEYAAFGNATVKLFSGFDITGGIRWAHNDQTFTQDQSGTFYPGGVHRTGATSDSVVTYSVSPRFHIDRDVMIYARVASGYRPGGANNALPGVPAGFKADTLTNYEAGIKGDFFHHLLKVDLSTYYIDWSNIQITVIPAPGISFTGNGNKATSRGVEFESTITPVKNLSFGVNVAYTDAHLNDNVPTLNGKAGDRLPLSARWNGSITANYDRELSGTWRAGIGTSVGYKSSVYSLLQSDPSTILLKGQTIVDANLHAEHGRYQFRVFAKNLFASKAYNDVYSNAAPAQLDFVPVPPRTIGASVDVRF